MRKYLSILLALLMVISLAACKGKTNNPTGPSVNMPSVEDSKNNENIVAIRTPATETEQSWFNQALRDYIQFELNIDNYYLNTNVYDAKAEMNASNALARASAMITLCVDSSTINANKASDFSDNLARKFALDKAAGEINFTIYRIPHNIYVQITDANYNTAIKESSGTEGFSKYSFVYGGTGDVILDSPSTTPSTQPSTEPSINAPEEDTPEDISNETPSIENDTNLNQNDVVSEEDVSVEETN